MCRRTTWAKKDKKKVVWRCINRREFGKKYGQHSPTISEKPCTKQFSNVFTRRSRTKSTSCKTYVTYKKTLSCFQKVNFTAIAGKTNRQVAAAFRTENEPRQSAAGNLEKEDGGSDTGIPVPAIAALYQQRGKLEPYRI